MIEAVDRRGVPFLGICVGIAADGRARLRIRRNPGPGWIGGEIRKIAPRGCGPAGPAYGLERPGDRTLVHPVLAGIDTGDHAYFVHSYQMEMTEPAHRLAHCDYGGDVTAIVGTGNRIGHPVPTPRKARPPGCG